MQSNRPLKLHLGCGAKDFGEEWTHIEGGNYPHVSSHDIIHLPFEENSAEIIYACHVLEYFDWNEAEKIVLKEWYRVLMPGGIIRLAVPDFMAMVKLYMNNSYGLDRFIGPLYGKMKMNHEDNSYIYHKCTYDFGTLCNILEKVGFTDCHRYDPFHTEHAHIHDFSQAHLPHMDFKHGTCISLNVEATK